jgi:hypothetical protein
LQYLAAWDIQEGIVMGRCEAGTGIEPFFSLFPHFRKNIHFELFPKG